MGNTGIDPIYKELAGKAGVSKSEILPKIFRKMANLEQAKILKELPAPSEEIAKKLNLKKETVDRNLLELFQKGLIRQGKHGYNLGQGWGSLVDPIGSSNLSQFKELDDEFLNLCMALTTEIIQERMALFAAIHTTGNPLPNTMRVIPRWEAIKDIPGILPVEDLREICKQLAQPVVVFNCPCKVMKPDRSCKDTIPTETCIWAGRAGQYQLNRGVGRKLTYEELLQYHKDLDKYGLVTMVMNTDRMPIQICNCHTCCCMAFRATSIARKRFNHRSFAKSRFIATINPEKCNASQVCIKRCPVKAISMKYDPASGADRAYVDPEECIGCGMCAVTCPSKAAKLKLVREPSHINPIMSPEALLDLTGV